MIQLPCEVCNQTNEDERAIFEQNGHVLCKRCYGYFDNEELEIYLEELNKWADIKTHT